MKTNLHFWLVLLLSQLFTNVFAQLPTEEWSRRYNGIGSQSEFSVAITVDAAGNSYVTGTTRRSYFSDAPMSIVTAKYSVTGEELWVKEFRQDEATAATAVAVDNQGGVYVTGRSGYFGNEFDYITIRYDAATGTESWVQRYNGESNGPDEAMAIAVDNAGGIYITGTSSSFGPTSNIGDYATIRYDAATGAQTWVQRYDSPAGDHDVATDIVVDNTGGVYITGNTATIRYNASTGAPTWIQPVGAIAIAADNAGGVYTAGNSFIAGTGNDFLSIRYDAATGQKSWEQRYNGPANGDDMAKGIVVDNTGGVFVTGTSEGSGTSGDFATLRYNAVTGAQTWLQRYDSGYDEVTGIAVDNMNGVYITGYSYVVGKGYDFATIRYDAPAGSLSWIKRFSGLAGGEDLAMALAVSNSGGVNVAGYSSQSSGGNDMVTLQYDRATGSQNWVSLLDVQGSLSDLSIAVAVDAAGNTYVTGTSRYHIDLMESWSRIVTVKYSPTGDELWVKEYQLGQRNGANDIAVDDQGGVYVTGYSTGEGTGIDYVTIRYNASTGEESWVSHYNGPDNHNDAARAIVVDNQGGVYVTGSSYGPESYISTSQYATLRYDAATGAQTWVQRYSGEQNGFDEANAIAVDNQGSVYVTGFSSGSSTVHDFATIRYDAATGTQRWVQRYNGGGNSYDVANAIAVNNRGSVFVTGFSAAEDAMSDYTTVRYDAATGAESWVQRYDGSARGVDVARAVAVDNTGGVYVTGSSWGEATHYDFATIRYDEVTGMESWVQRYNGAGNEFDGASAIAVDNQGGVYVTGPSISNDGNNVFSTLKYATADGTQLWNVQSSGPYDHAADLALDAAGNVMVTGYSRTTATDNDFFTIKYSQDHCPQLAEATISGSTTAAVGTKGSSYSLPETGASTYTWRITDSNGNGITSFSGQGTSAISVNWPSTPQVYKLSVTYGGSQSCPTNTSSMYVHVFDTKAGFVTGGGWLRSPTHPDYEFMQTSSRAYFGLMAKYKKGEENQVQGETQLLVENGTFYFRGSLHQARSLVITGNQAFYRGQGKVSYRDKAGKFTSDPRTFGFLVAATDGNFGKASGKDQLRIQVWEIRSNGSRGMVVYDNQAACATNLDDNATACQAINGNIIIHAPNMMGEQNSKLIAAETPPAPAALEAFPTAFSDRTTVAFSTDQDTDYTLELYDLKGALVRQLAAGAAETGKRYEHELQAKGMARGMYLVRLSTGSTVHTVRLVLEK